VSAPAYLACATGERLRVELPAETRWSLVWVARGPQRETDHEVVIAKGRGGVDCVVPVDAPPSYPGALVAVTWWLRREAEEPLPVRVTAGSGALNARVAAWERWERADARQGAFLGLTWGLYTLACLAIGLVLVLGAWLLPWLPALVVTGAMGLVVVGALASVRSALAERRGRGLLVVAPAGAGVPGEAVRFHLEIPPQVALAGPLTWVLRCTERAAVRVPYTDRGQRRERLEWQERVVYTARGASGPPAPGQLSLPLPADAPPSLAAPLRLVMWELSVTCGEAREDRRFLVVPAR
jgi:hypothetical protein